MSKTNKKFAGILEYLWLLFAIVAGIMGIYKSVTIGFKNSYMLFVVAFISLIMFLIRRSMRRKSDN